MNNGNKFFNGIIIGLIFLIALFVGESSAKPQMEFQAMLSNGSNTIVFTLPEAQKVKVGLFTVLGKEIATKVDGFVSAGVHSVSLGPLAKGFYFIKFTSSALSVVKIVHIIQ
jgi:hypothetical protein